MKEFKIDGKKHWEVEVEPNSTDFAFSKSGRWFLWKRYMLSYNNYFPTPRITIDTSVRFRKKPIIVGIAKKCLSESCMKINDINPYNLIISA